MRGTIRYLARKSGLEIKRYTPAASHSLQLQKCLDHLGTNLILDVGANKGQFAKELRATGYTGKIVSFEPLEHEHAILHQAANNDPSWSVYSRTAIGAETGSVEINVSFNSVSSSILGMMESHKQAARASAYIDKQSVPLNTIDSIAAELIEPGDNVFLKIDTQGYEEQVLKGGRKTLKGIKGVLCELSMIPLYEGQADWKSLTAFFEKEGFVLWAVQPGFTDANTGRTLQFDGIFVRGS